MPLKETHIYIRCPVGELVNRIGNNPVSRVSDDEDSDVIYSVAGPDGEPWFGLMADHHAPSGKDWTHLLHSSPKDQHNVAQSLLELQVTPEMLQSATDWDDNPLVALQPITAIQRDFAKRALADATAEI